MRVSSAFVTKFNEAVRVLEETSPLETPAEILCRDCDHVWESGEDKCPICDCEHSYVNVVRPLVPRKLAVEEFLDRLREISQNNP